MSLRLIMVVGGWKECRVLFDDFGTRGRCINEKFDAYCELGGKESMPDRM